MYCVQINSNVHRKIALLYKNAMQLYIEFAAVRSWMVFDFDRIEFEMWIARAFCRSVLWRQQVRWQHAPAGISPN